MALTLLSQDTRTGILDVVEFDAVLSEQATEELEVTQHPVENGADIADNARLKLTTLSMRKLVSGELNFRELRRRRSEV